MPFHKDFIDEVRVRTEAKRSVRWIVFLLPFMSLFIVVTSSSIVTRSLFAGIAVVYALIAYAVLHRRG